jgi:holin-like protein
MKRNSNDSAADKDEKKPSNVLTQIVIYAAVLFVSSILSALMPKSFPIPVPVWGLIILYILLTTKVIKLHQVEKMSTFLIGIIGFLFVPSGIQLYQNLDIIKDDGLKLILAIIFSTIIILVVIAFTTKLVIFISNKIRHRGGAD